MSPIKKLMFILVLLQLTACATNFKQGLEHFENYNAPRALKFFERDAKQGDRTSALYASQLYISDYRIPRDVEKSKYYLNAALNAEYAHYDQAYDHFIPLIKAWQILEDDRQYDKSLAFQMLNYEKYQTSSSALSLRAVSHLIGYGLEENVAKGKALFERAIEQKDKNSTELYFAWWLSIHPDNSFRNSKRALSLALKAIEASDSAEKSLPLNILAASYAINKQYNKAIETQMLALEILNSEIESYPHLIAFTAGYKARLHRYQKQEAWVLSEADIARCGFDSIRCIKE